MKKEKITPDITVIILTKNEEKNIKKCISSCGGIAKRIVVVDSGSIDDTIEIAKVNGAEIYFHEWETHARQFNWALDNCSIQSEWVYRLDADEQITKELEKEICEALQSDDAIYYNAFSMRWQMYFMGQHLKHGGTHKTYVTRLFRYGKARVEDKAMDERFIIEGRTKQLKSDFVHYDYKGLDEWLLKHIKYSNLELQRAYGNDNTLDNKVQKKKRGLYYKLPLFLRAKLYYWYRYYGQLGFLDGKAGKIFIYLQAYWFRFIVDARIYEAKYFGEKK